MVDSVFQSIVPVLKAVLLADGTYSLAANYPGVAPGTGADLVFNTIPPLKAVDLGDGTYAMACKIVPGA
jgi:hypothetical protein